MIKKTILFFSFILAAVFAGGPAVYAESDTQTVNLAFSIDPVTIVKTESSAGGGNVRLGPVVAGVDSPLETLEVQIITNTNERYRVCHTLKNEIMSNSGGQFPDNELLFRVSNGTNGGVSSFSGMVPVPSSRAVIFDSPKNGGVERFTISYAVANKQSYGAGNYYGNVNIDTEPA
jgi:hypothetical protein